MEAGEILLKRGLLSERQLAQARVAHGEGQRIDQAAVSLGFLTEEQALTALGAEMGLEFVDLADPDIDLSVWGIFPQERVRRQHLFARRRDNGSLVVATSDPF